MLHIGIIGLGAIGQRLLKQFTNHPEVEVVAVCDQLESLVNETAGALGNVQAYTDYREVIANDSVDLIYVAVPPKFHHRIVMDVLASGKHVLCEKPLANSIEEAGEMLQAAREANVVHAMNFPMNYESAANQFAALLEQGYIGKLRRVQLSLQFPEWPRAWQQNNWVGGREQGGFVLEVGVHFIQQTLKIFGDINNIQSQLDLPDDPAKCETGIIATAELADGTPFLIEGMSHLAGEEHIGFTAYGTDGVLSLTNWGQLSGGKTGEKVHEISLEQAASKSLVDELVKAVKGEDALIYDFEVGYKAQQVLEKLRQK